MSLSLETTVAPSGLSSPGGAVARHLRRAEGKGEQHSMRNVDFIYMINLDTRPEKYALARRYLEVHGITPYRFPAVNGWELSKQAIQDVGLKYQPGMTPLLATRYPSEVAEFVQSHELMAKYGETYFMHCMPLGAIGCVLSHLSVLQDAWDCGYETIWVMEDDVDVLSDPHRISDLLEELDECVGASQWDVLFTDVDYRTGPGEYLTAHGAPKRPDLDNSQERRYSSEYTETFQLNNHFRKVAARFGSSSMLIRRGGIAKLLAFFRAGIFGPYDLENHLPAGIRRYGLTFDLVTNMLHPISDIGVPATESADPTVESFLQRYPEPVYQDLIIGGDTYRIGTDLCECRYELIRPVLNLHGRAFSVLDVGAAQGYFSFRIAREYPQSVCVMAESDDTSYYAHHGSMLKDLCLLNGPPPNVVHLDARLDLADLNHLRDAEQFDVVLALLVVHLMDETLRAQIAILHALMSLGEHLIVEVAGEVGVLCTAYVEYLASTLNARYLGEVERHKDPRSRAVGRLFWFRRQTGAGGAAGRERSRLALLPATLARLNAVDSTLAATE
jgi:GR25 family glycosyltransferase involved in LPS biosynthesis